MNHFEEKAPVADPEIVSKQLERLHGRLRSASGKQEGQRAVQKVVVQDEVEVVTSHLATALDCLAAKGNGCLDDPDFNRAVDIASAHVRTSTFRVNHPIVSVVVDHVWLLQQVKDGAFPHADLGSKVKDASKVTANRYKYVLKNVFL